jgi:type II secretory pathway pseudopilin PulG
VKKLPISLRHSGSGATLVEVVVAAAIIVILSAILAVGLVTVQRTFAASEHHAQSQTAQIRIVDYIARDLRRALTVTARAGGTGLDLTIPDYYVSSDTRNVTPRDPQITAKGDVVYGTRSIPISYYERTDARGNHLVCRSYDGVETILATDVERFELALPEGLNGDVITVSVSFVPRFQMSSSARQKMRDGTTVFTSTLLRNKRALDS